VRYDPCQTRAMKNSISRMTKRTIPAIGALALVFATSCSRPASQPNRPSNRSVDASGTRTFPGYVVAIADGDTITVLDSANTQHRVRLEGIDAPESHQAFGEQSRQSLSGMIFGKDVSVSYQKVDQYGRLVGKIMLDGKDINLEQVKAGMAWHYKFYEDEQTPEERELYDRAEAEARTARRGLWQDPNPTEPYQFRKEEKRERDAR
jgi:endonuclease YncB( thermonuclease family)